MRKNKEIHTYAIDIIREEDGKSYYVIVPSLPGCFSQGKTIEEAKKNAAKAIQLHIREMRRAGEPAPTETTTFQTSIQIAA